MKKALLLLILLTLGANCTTSKVPALAAGDATDWFFHYDKAVAYETQKKHDKAYKSLNKAAELAIESLNEQKMLERLLTDQNGALRYLAAQAWQPLPLMLDYRWYPAMTQLADGRLLIVGGGGLNNPVRVNTSELYDPLTGQTEWADTVAIRMEQSPILTLYSGKILMTFRPPQLFDPVTEQWDLAADFVQGNRMPNGDHCDHELAMLADGRVIAVGGEGAPGNEPPQSIIEAFSPPYLFRGVRPELSNFNKTVFQRGETVEFEANKTNALTKVMLMSHAVMTHFMNSGNGRCLELDFTHEGNQVSATLPSDSLRLMPGWYMLFGMVDDIPSVAQIVKIEAGQFVSAAGEAPSAVLAFRVFPNPLAAGGFLTVEMELQRAGEVRFELTDATSKTVRNLSFFEKTTDRQVFMLKTGDVSAGVYFLTARLEGAALGTQKVILK